MRGQNKTNQNKEKKEQKTKKLVQASVKERTIIVHIEMEKRTGKVALEITNDHFTFWKDIHFLFVSHCYRCSRHLASSVPVKYIWKTTFFFYNFVTHETPDRGCWLSFICEFKNVLLTYSQLGFAGFIIIIIIIIISSSSSSSSTV